MVTLEGLSKKHVQRLFVSLCFLPRIIDCNSVGMVEKVDGKRSVV